MRLYTIGFTKKSAEQFFSALKASGAKRLLDVRLNNVSQLAGFSKRDDMRFFLRAVCGMDFRHLVELAPTQEMLDAYKKHGESWDAYAASFLDLLTQRRVESAIPRDLIADSVLLCSEARPEQCHRRLVAEYLRDKWGDVDIVHL